MADDVTFPMPAGFAPPENLTADGTFQAMATFRVDGDNLELVDIDGHSIGEGADEMAQETEAANAAAAVRGVGGAGGPPVGGPPPPPPNASEDQIPAGGSDRIGGYAEAMGQRFKAAMSKVSKAKK
jgi:hypothetical protein